MNNRSIAFQLSIYILTAVTLVISVIVFLHYNFSRKILIQKIEESAIHQSKQITAQVTRNIVTAQEVSRNVANQALYYQSHGDLEFFLSQALTSNPLMTGFHVELFNPSGSQYLSVIRTDSTSYQIFRDDRFCAANITPTTRIQVVGGETVWSEPFFCLLDTSRLIASYSQAIYTPDGAVGGIISGQISLDFLNKVVSGMMFEKGGFAFIVGEDGTFLTHPKQEWIMQRNIYEISYQIFPENRDKYEQLLRSHLAGSGFAYPELYDYKRSWFHFSPIPYTNWSVIIIVPAKELFNDLDLILREIILVSAIGLLLVLAIIVLIFRKMLLPLASVVKSIQRFSFGDRRRLNRKNEVELLNDSLQELQTQYSNYLQEQNQSRKDRRKFEKDLKSAKEIQTAIIPKEYATDPDHPEIELFAALQPAESIGGDLYDYFFIDSKHLLFTMGDVSGKGIPAALFMAVAHTMIKNKANALSAKKIIEQVNKELSYQNTNQHFLTLFLGILNTETGVLNYCNAAHNYPFIVRPNKEVRLLEKTHGLPVGVYANKPYSGDYMVLEKGDMLVLYTDGVTDCKDSGDTFYGIDRLTDNISNMTDLPAPELVKRLLKSLTVFRGETRQADDISLMAIRYHGKDHEKSPDH